MRTENINGLYSEITLLRPLSRPTQSGLNSESVLIDTSCLELRMGGLNNGPVFISGGLNSGPVQLSSGPNIEGSLYRVVFILSGFKSET